MILQQDFANALWRFCTLEITDDYAINKRVYYEISFPKDKSEEILLDCGVLERGEDGSPVIAVNIPEFVIQGDCCKKAFVKGAFVGCATSNIRLSVEATKRHQAAIIWNLLLTVLTF